MVTSTRDSLTPAQAAHFFLGPETPRQRQYEALRAYFVAELPATEVARRFGYTTRAFRVLCHQFRHDPGKRSTFFQTPQHGPRSARARDRVRERVVALRKQNLSVYDIQLPATPSVSIPSPCSCGKKGLHACHAVSTRNAPRRSNPKRPL